MQFALNHVTVPGLALPAFADLARALGCSGVELRNDLTQPLFDGAAPEAARQLLEARGLRLVALAEVTRFDAWEPGKEASALALIRQARAAGAAGVALIPCNDGSRPGRLRQALAALGPMLEDHGQIGLIEPLGFETASLRRKEEAAGAIATASVPGAFRLVHDTFHHALAGETGMFPALTGLVHVSGVLRDGPLAQLTDADRVLVTEGDRLGSAAQLRALTEAGWTGTVSFECFAPSVQQMAAPDAALRQSIAYLRAALGQGA